LKARLSNVRSDLEEVLSRLDQDMMSWSPAPGMRTVSGQLVEIAITELQIVLQLQEGRWIPDEEAKQLVGDCDSLRNLAIKLASIRANTLAYLDSLSPSALEEQVMVRTQGLPSNPRSEVFRTIAQHEYYHVGQLVSYLWARGDDPYRW